MCNRAGVPCVLEALLKPRFLRQLSHRLTFLDLYDIHMPSLQSSHILAICSLERLTYLRIVSLWHHHDVLSSMHSLPAVPTEISRLAHLTELCFSFAPFAQPTNVTVSQLPLALSALHALRTIKVVCCNDPHGSLAQLQGPTQLCLCRVHMHLPASPMSLGSLLELVMIDTVLSGPLHSLTRLGSLRKLMLQSTRPAEAGMLPALADAVRQLTQLSSVQLNEIEWGVDLSMFNSRAVLEDLQVKTSGVIAMPAIIEMPKLTSLVLEGMASHSLRAMPAIAQLRLLSALTHLEITSHSGNFDMPESLVDLCVSLPSLECLHVSNFHTDGWEVNPFRDRVYEMDSALADSRVRPINFRWDDWPIY